MGYPLPSFSRYVYFAFHALHPFRNEWLKYRLKNVS